MRQAETLPTAAFFRAAALVGVLGTLTTAANIALAQFVPDPGGDPLRAAALSRDEAYMLLQWVLLLHAVTTLVPPVALACVRFPTLIGVAGLGALFTGMEKFTELTGQTVRIFVLNGVWRPALLATNDTAELDRLVSWQAQFSAVWDSLYFVLWTCGTLAAVCFAIGFWRSPQQVERWLARTAVLVAVLGVLLTLADYFGQRWATGLVHPLLYGVAMTSYRALIAAVLWRAARHAASRQES